MTVSHYQIGDTPLRRLKGATFDGFIAYLKDESANPFGTIKDRRNAFIVQEALRLGVDKLALITAGNNAYSLAKIANNDMKITAIIDKGLPDETKKILSSVVYQVTEINLQHKILRPEEVITIAREKEDEVIWDVTNGYEESYTSVVAEIRELQPDYLVVPVGSGAIFIGIIEGVLRYKLSAQVIGIGVQNTLKSFADKLYTPWSPYNKVMTKYGRLGHPIYRLTEPEVKAVWHEYQHIAPSEPSSATIFAAIDKHRFKPSDKVVFINTGRLLVA